VARCWLDDNDARENVVRPPPALESGVDGGSTHRSGADSGMSAPAMMRTSILRLQSFLLLRYLAQSHDHEHNN
jgi:hypothetical protein